MPSSPSETGPQFKEETALLHAGRFAGDLPATVNPPIQRGSTVLLDSAAALHDASRVTYGREGLATHAALRSALAALEHGDEAFLYPSGLAAIAAAMLAFLETGDEVLMVDSVYAPTRRFAVEALARFGITARFFDPAMEVKRLATLISPATRLIVLESPGSQTFDVVDVPAIARIARSLGILTMMDNTWSAGLLFKPLDHGVDVSIQAVTKYIGGHSDLMMGAAIARGAAAARLKRSYCETGWTVSPDDAYQALRGLRTLPTRLARHGENALAVARWLESRPEVAEVLCPALPGARGHALWKRDFTGISGLFAAVLNPVPEAAVAEMVSSLKLFGLGFSWGGYESLIIPGDGELTTRRFKPRYAGPLIRLHVGLEDPADLIADLAAGLSRLAVPAREVAAE